MGQPEGSEECDGQPAGFEDQPAGFEGQPAGFEGQPVGFEGLQRGLRAYQRGLRASQLGTERPADGCTDRISPHSTGLCPSVGAAAQKERDREKETKGKRPIK